MHFYVQIEFFLLYFCSLKVFTFCYENNEIKKKTNRNYVIYVFCVVYTLTVAAIPAAAKLCKIPFVKVLLFIYLSLNFSTLHSLMNTEIKKL